MALTRLATQLNNYFIGRSAMNQIEASTTTQYELRYAQRIIDEVHENPLHPANDRLHPSHEKALAAIYSLEEWVFKLAIPDNIMRVNTPKNKVKRTKSKQTKKCA